ncbi:MAG: hypothetical protein PHE73_03430 [Sulfurovaceae bacterium]|nr:hypothetical protein [Sulfurovaceae bacterium]
MKEYIKTIFTAILVLFLGTTMFSAFVYIFDIIFGKDIGGYIALIDLVAIIIILETKEEMR